MGTDVQAACAQTSVLIDLVFFIRSVVAQSVGKSAPSVVQVGQD